MLRWKRRASPRRLACPCTWAGRAKRICATATSAHRPTMCWPDGWTTDGNLVALEHRQASGDVAFDFLPGFLSAVMGADFGAYRGARIRYAVPNKRTIAWRTPLPVRTGWWRGPGSAGQHLCRGVLHGRTGSQRRGRPGGVSAAAPPGRRPFPAAHEGRDPGRCRKGWVGRTAAGRTRPGHRRHPGCGHGGRSSGRNLRWTGPRARSACTGSQPRWTPA